MAFGVKRVEPAPGQNSGRKIVKAITTETIVALVIVGGLFASFAWKMGLAHMFKTMMGTAHDLLLNTVLFPDGGDRSRRCLHLLYLGVWHRQHRQPAALAVDEAALWPAGSHLDRRRGDLSVGQSRHHAPGRRQGVPQVPQEVATDDPDQPGHRLWHGSHCHDLHVGPIRLGSAPGEGRPAGQHRGDTRRNCQHPTHGLFRQEKVRGRRGRPHRRRKRATTSCGSGRCERATWPSGPSSRCWMAAPTASRPVSTSCPASSSSAPWS